MILHETTDWRWLNHDNHSWKWNHGITREFFDEKCHNIHKTSEEFFQEKEKWKIEAKKSNRHAGRNATDGQGEKMEKRDLRDMDWDLKQYKIYGDPQMMKISDILNTPIEVLMSGNDTIYNNSVVHCMIDFDNENNREEILDIIETYVLISNANNRF